MSRFTLEPIDFSAPPAAAPSETSPHPPPPPRRPRAAKIAVPPPTHDTQADQRVERRRTPRTSPADDDRVTTATFVVSPRHRQLIRDRARTSGRFQWVWLSEVILTGCPKVSDVLERPRRLGPTRKPEHVHYTVNLTEQARELLAVTAEQHADGDRSFLLRHLLDQLPRA